MAEGVTRRSHTFVLAGLLILAGVPAAFAHAELTEVCHQDGQGRWLTVGVASMGNALDAHIRHGDGVPGGPVPNLDGHSFDEACAPTEDAIIFAIAYTDLVDDGGAYDPAVDVVITKLVDGNGNGILDSGDRVISHQYPRDFDFASAGFGDFTVTEHPVTFSSSGERQCSATSGVDKSFQWSRWDQDQETYSESETPFDNTLIRDMIVARVGWEDEIRMDPFSPSRPSDAIVAREPNAAGDVPFFDVDLNCLNS